MQYVEVHAWVDAKQYVELGTVILDYVINNGLTSTIDKFGNTVQVLIKKEEANG